MYYLNSIKLILKNKKMKLIKSREVRKYKLDKEGKMIEYTETYRVIPVWLLFIIAFSSCVTATLLAQLL